MKFYYVYILRNLNTPARHYIGLTDDLNARLKKHNKGGCPHTAKYRPWKIETAMAFTDKKKASAFEQYLKTGSGQALAKRHF